MYTLRTVSGNGNFNRLIGSAYNTINRFEHAEKFRNKYKKYFGKDHVADLDSSSDDFSKNIIGFIETKSNDSVPIYKNESNYIMLDGKTVEFLNSSMTKQNAD